MLRHLVLIALVFLSATIIHAIPADVEPIPSTNIDVPKATDNTDDLDTSASSWGGYGIRQWFSPSYYSGWGGRGYYGNGWGNRHYYGGGWGGHRYGGGWGRGYGYGGGWNGYRGGWWW